MVRKILGLFKLKTIYKDSCRSFRHSKASVRTTEKLKKDLGKLRLGAAMQRTTPNNPISAVYRNSVSP